MLGNRKVLSWVFQAAALLGSISGCATMGPTPQTEATMPSDILRQYKADASAPLFQRPRIFLPYRGDLDQEYALNFNTIIQTGYAYLNRDLAASNLELIGNGMIYLSPRCKKLKRIR